MDDKIKHIEIQLEELSDKLPKTSSIFSGLLVPVVLALLVFNAGYSVYAGGMLLIGSAFGALVWCILAMLCERRYVDTSNELILTSALLTGACERVIKLERELKDKTDV